MLTRWLILLALAAIAAFGGACATTPSPPADERENNVSSLPWARPQSWEGAGGMGGMRPPGTGGGY